MHGVDDPFLNPTEPTVPVQVQISVLRAELGLNLKTDESYRVQVVHRPEPVRLVNLSLN